MKLKRLFVLPVLALYMLAVSGVMIHMHYCGMQLASWNVYLKSDGCAGECGDESAPGHSCCSDKVIAAKMAQDHSISFAKYKTAADEVCLLPAPLPDSYAPALLRSVRAGAAVCRSNAPPGTWQDIPLYKLHARLTYYG